MSMIEYEPARPAGRRLCKYVPNYVIFDLETTGLSVKTDAVIEISAIKVIGGKVVDEFSTLVNPGMPIPYYASSVNGITDRMVKDAPRIKEALSSFLDFAGDEILVGHNISGFDMKFICRDADIWLSRTISNDYVDTVLLSRAILPDMSHTLTDLAKFCGISTEGAHRALNDCRMNQIIFERLALELKAPSSSSKVNQCPSCGSPLKLRNGKFGEFWGCMSYPNCKFTRKK